MKQYKFLVTINEQSDEYFECLNEMDFPEAVADLKAFLEEILEDRNFDATIESRNYYQTELDFGYDPKN